MKMIDCPECDGIGEIEYDVPRPHAGGFNCGYIDTELGDCENCNGLGKIEEDSNGEDDEE